MKHIIRNSAKPQAASGVKAPSAMDRAIGFISGVFAPALPVITAAGILKALILLLSAVGLLQENSSTYYIFSFVSSAGFYFLPLLLAHSAAKRCGGNPYLAVFLTAILFHPDFTSLVEQGKSLTWILGFDDQELQKN